MQEIINMRGLLGQLDTIKSASIISEKNPILDQLMELAKNAVKMFKASRPLSGPDGQEPLTLKVSYGIKNDQTGNIRNTVHQIANNMPPSVDIMAASQAFKFLGIDCNDTTGLFSGYDISAAKNGKTAEETGALALPDRDAQFSRFGKNAAEMSALFNNAIAGTVSGNPYYFGRAANALGQITGFASLTHAANDLAESLAGSNGILNVSAETQLGTSTALSLNLNFNPMGSINDGALPFSWKNTFTGSLGIGGGTNFAKFGSGSSTFSVDGDYSARIGLGYIGSNGGLNIGNFYNNSIFIPVKESFFPLANLNASVTASYVKDSFSVSAGIKAGPPIAVYTAAMSNVKGQSGFSEGFDPNNSFLPDLTGNISAGFQNDALTTLLNIKGNLGAGTVDRLELLFKMGPHSVINTFGLPVEFSGSFGLEGGLGGINFSSYLNHMFGKVGFSMNLGDLFGSSRNPAASISAMTASSSASLTTAVNASFSHSFVLKDPVTEAVELTAPKLTELPRPESPNISSQIITLPEVEVFPETAPKEILIKNGDTLWDIASSELGKGARWRELEVYDSNGSKIELIDPRKLRPGMRVRVQGKVSEGNTALAASERPPVQEQSTNSPLLSREMLLKAYTEIRSETGATISLQAFEKAYTAYAEMVSSGKVRPGKLLVCDFTMHNSENRFYVLEVDPSGGITIKDAIKVAHGSGTDKNNDGWADIFSNVQDTHASSMGSFRISERTFRPNSLGFVYFLDGLDSTNYLARRRNIYIHSTKDLKKQYVPEKNVPNVRTGNSWGCFTLNTNDSDRLGFGLGASKTADNDISGYLLFAFFDPEERKVSMENFAAFGTSRPTGTFSFENGIEDL